jgi:hypothetical protein
MPYCSGQSRDAAYQNPFHRHQNAEAQMAGIRLLVSYADLNQGHEGKIYQASNWYYAAKPSMSPASR